MIELFQHLSESARLRNVGLREGSPDQARDEHGRWQTFSGGTGAAEGKHSYSRRMAHGEYHVNPISSHYGRHRGYSATFADTKGQMGGGLWHTVTPEGSLKNFNGHEPTFRSPNQAKRAAMTHANSIAGTRPED